MELKYEPNVTVDAFAQMLFSNRERDMRLKTTATGPHRDDISFVVNGVDIRKFGSQAANSCIITETFRNRAGKEADRGYSGPFAG